MIKQINKNADFYKGILGTLQSKDVDQIQPIRWLDFGRIHQWHYIILPQEQKDSILIEIC